MPRPKKVLPSSVTPQRRKRVQPARPSVPQLEAPENIQVEIVYVPKYKTFLNKLLSLKFILILLLFLIISYIIKLTVDNFSQIKSVNSSITQESPVIEIPVVNSSINQLNDIEKQLEKQNFLIKKLENDNENLNRNMKHLEKRLQANTEVIKRMCEFIVIITIEKKLIPRHCLPEYNWRREENGN